MAAEDIKIVPYDPRWPEMFRQQADWLLLKLGADVVLRVEHMGSTAVPGLCAKPIIDMLAEIPSFEVGERIIVSVLQHQGWDYFWRDDRPPGHMMFIRHDTAGVRTHHLHMAPASTSLWDRLAFRDYLRASGRSRALRGPQAHADESACGGS